MFELTYPILFKILGTQFLIMGFIALLFEASDSSKRAMTRLFSDNNRIDREDTDKMYAIVFIPQTCLIFITIILLIWKI